MKCGRDLFSILLLFTVLISGCSFLPTDELSVPDTPDLEASVEEGARPGNKCGDGVCDQLERDRGICPEDCPQEAGSDEMEEVALDYENISEYEYYVTNPTSGAKLYVRVYPSPSSAQTNPAIIFIPGGTGDSRMFTDDLPGGSIVERFATAGYTSVVFNPDGRGRSEGVEDFNGFTGQDGLHAVTQFVKQLPHTGDIGYISFSYGVSLGTGALARYPDSPVIFLIDWEGPANRFDSTVGCRSSNTDISLQDGPQDHSCEDEAYWVEREAQTFAREIRAAYHRLQSQEDHVQPDASHAVDMIQAATHTMYGGEGQSPWTQLNEFEPNTIFTEEIEQDLPENDTEKVMLMIRSARELFTRFGSSQSAPGSSGQDSSRGLVQFGFMVHLEGWKDEANDQAQFEKHMGAALELAEVFEEHGAKVTFEASPETVAGNAMWENVLLELENRGHSIGVHADRGYSNNPNYDLQLFTIEIAAMKEAAEDLGVTIQHVSGTCSSLDWARASIDAGYLFTTGGVGFCAMSMPEELRPSDYRSCTNPAACHGSMPQDMADRIHPWRVSTALGDWTQDDPDGELVILSSDGGIKNLYEESLNPDDSHGDMEYTVEDITIVVEKVDEAIQLADPDSVNILYFSLSIGAADVDVQFYTAMFDALQPYVDAGLLQYSTMNEMFEMVIRQ